MVHRRTNPCGRFVTAAVCPSLLMHAPVVTGDAGDDSFVANVAQTSPDVATGDSVGERVVAAPRGAGYGETVGGAQVTAGSATAEEFIDRPVSPAKELNQNNVDLSRAGIALVVVLVLIGGVALLVRRFSAGARVLGRGGCMQIVLRTSISPKQSLCLAKLGDRLLLLGLSPNHIASLDTIDDPEDVARILGQIESGRSNSISKTFAGIVNHESATYDDEVTVPEELGDSAAGYPEYTRAQGDLGTLLDKVKGLSRMHFRS